MSTCILAWPTTKMASSWMFPLKRMWDLSWGEDPEDAYSVAPPSMKDIRPIRPATRSIRQEKINQRRGQERAKTDAHRDDQSHGVQARKVGVQVVHLHSSREEGNKLVRSLGRAFVEHARPWDPINATQTLQMTCITGSGEARYFCVLGHNSSIGSITPIPTPPVLPISFDDAPIGCLKTILEYVGQAPVYVVIDALDECPDASRHTFLP